MKTQFLQFLASIGLGRKNVTSLSAVRMQSLGVLKVFLEQAYNERVTFTQVQVAVTKPVAEQDKLYCEATIEAFYFWNGRVKQYGHEGEAPLPPKVTMLIKFKSEKGQVLCWEVAELPDWNIENSSVVFPMGMGDCFNAIKEFETAFNDHRPWGFAIMPASHDVTRWEINPAQS